MTHGRSFLHSEYLRPSSLTFRCPHNSSNGTPQQTPPTPKHPIRPFLSTTLRCGGGRFVSQCRAPARVVCWLSPGRDASERLSACRGERESGPLLPHSGLEPAVPGAAMGCEAPGALRPPPAGSVPAVLPPTPQRAPPRAAGGTEIHRDLGLRDRTLSSWHNFGEYPHCWRGTVPFTTSLCAHTCKTAMLRSGMAFPKTLR